LTTPDKQPEVPNIEIINIRPRYIYQLEKLQRLCFPTLGDGELIRAAHYLNHYEIFPEGNFIALHDDRPVGAGSGFLIDFDFAHPDHNFNEMLDGGWFSHHDPNGDWYYGADISIHPDYRAYGLGRRLYDARKSAVRMLNKRGIIAGGLLPGYVRYRGILTVHEYTEQVVAGKIWDATLSFQIKNGFQVRGMLEDYIEDYSSDNWAALIVWENPDYQPSLP